MDLHYVLLYFLSMLPIVEGRYALGYAIGYELNPYLSVLTVSLGTTSLAIALSLAFPFIDKFFLSLREDSWLSRTYRKTVLRVREKVRPYVEKYGTLGLTLFVAVPLPVTGIWTGGIAAYFLGMGKKAMIPLIIGGIISNLISFFVVAPRWLSF